MTLPKPNRDDKLSYEILDLQNKTSSSGTFATYTWPMFSSIATLLLTILVAYVSLRTQSRQAEMEEKQKNAEQGLKKQELLNDALKLATDNSAGPDRRIAGIRALAQFWSEPAYEETVASTLAAELGLEDEKDRFVRCAAADVLGEAIAGEESYHGGKQEERSQRLARLLYGDREKGTIGIVIREHKLLVDAGRRPKEESDTDPCLTAIGASREAIRLNWEFLRKANLNDVDLTGANLYEADLSEASFIRSTIEGTNLRCANLYEADFGEFRENPPVSFSWTGARLGVPNFLHANIKGASPKSFVEWIKRNGFKPVEMDDSEWQRWRKNHFRVDKDENPLLDPAQNKNGAFCPCDQFGPVVPRC